MSFAVLDTETTGFSPAKGASIIDIGIVLADPDGVVEDTWDTLVRPAGGVGPTHVHGVTAAMVASAPRWPDVAGDVVELLRGRVVVAHNLAFDKRFIDHHLSAVGVDVPLSGVCTMSWARRTLRLPSSRLDVVSAHLGVELTGAHSALGDALATAGVLAAALADLGELPAPLPWPRMPVPRRVEPVSRAMVASWK